MEVVTWKKSIYPITVKMKMKGMSGAGIKTVNANAINKKKKNQHVAVRE